MGGLLGERLRRRDGSAAVQDNDVGADFFRKILTTGLFLAAVSGGGRRGVSPPVRGARWVAGAGHLGRQASSAAPSPGEPRVAAPLFGACRRGFVRPGALAARSPQPRPPNP